MDTTQAAVTAKTECGTFRRAERSDILLRIEFLFAGVPVLHGVVDNASPGGLFAHCTEWNCERMVGREGVCRVFMGMDYMEIPCLVVRVVGDGLGIRLKEGYDEEYNIVMGHVQGGDTAEMGLDINFTEVGVHSQMGGEVHPV